MISLGLARDGSPLIYNFLGDYLPAALKKLGYRSVKLEMERLEPIDRIYSNIDMPDEEIKRIFEKFCKVHGLKKGKSLTATGERTSVRAEVKVAELHDVIKHYNVLFDIFFASLTITADGNLKIEVMDAASGSVLAMGSKQILDKFGAEIRKQNRTTKIVYVEKKGKK
jgi:hypothetical protein